MSKIEEGFVKAKTLRESEGDDNKHKLNSLRKIEPKKVNSHYIVTANEPDSSIAEEYRRLKSLLIRETKSDFLNTIMVTSSVSSEGKTLSSINLAVTLAQEIDHSVLLIDADLRKPMVHNYLGIDYKYGLSDYLTQDIDISDVLIKTEIGNLVILPAGGQIENPVELLSSEKMKALIKKLKHEYMDRYIIVDTPPILSFADGIALGSYVDGVVFVVMEGSAKKVLIRNALNLIKKLNVLGIVFNKASMTNLDGHYYHPNYYYYKKEKKE